MNNNFGIIELYCGASGKIGFYNNQELGICKAMSKLGYKCFVFYPDIENKTISEEEYGETIVVRCPAIHIGVHSFYDWNILKKYDIAYAQIDSDNQFFASSVIKHCVDSNINYYNYIGTIKSDSDSPIKRLISSIILKRNLKFYKESKCFAKTKQVRSELTNKGIKDAEIVHVGLDLSLIPEIHKDKNKLKKELNITADKKVLLFVGRMENYKRPFDIFNVFRKLDNNYYGIMIGTGSLSEEIDGVINNEFNRRIIRIDRIENKKIHQYYKVSDFFLNFNEKEIFGMSMLEAMNQGCNVIAVRSPGAEEIINDKKTGFLVSNVNEMIDIINNGARLDEKTMKQSIIDDFSWDSSVKHFDDYLKAQ